MKNSRAKKDLAITGAMARWYNKSTRSRMESFSIHADMIAEKLAGGAKILEVAPGPGYLSIELAGRGFAVTGVELSADMVAIEKVNAADIEEELKTMHGLSGFDRWFIRLSFKTFLRNGAYNQSEFEDFAKNSPFPKFEITKRGCGFGVWLFKAAEH
jgi:hypothetical protein